ncbi:MAG: response regulator [Clostridium sp.]|uniref:response regulator n=1 Tax=Clostridium sp. TaxID=1506 RepID=UPI002A8F52BC|nr:response regulator [Clostridium sp.]MDY5096975.1 response regulator [Clostridium sp.]
MKLYLIDDDKNVLNILKMIIEDRQLGSVCGTCNNGEDALSDVKLCNPDIIIVDLLMPEMDGITFVKKAKSFLLDTAFIMLSQVSSKDMIANAYESGVEFFIQKPINSVEVVTVLNNVIQTLSMNRTLLKMQNIFEKELGTTQPDTPFNLSTREPRHITKLKSILQKLGILGDHGSKDIITLVDYLIKNEEHVGESTLHELCSKFSDSPKSVEQRIRRAAIAGMVNLANLGIEDYSNDTFIEYASSIYNFEQVRKEMNYIRGKSERHGNVKIKNFLNSLVAFSKN